MREFIKIVESLEINEVEMIDGFEEDRELIDRVFGRWTQEGADAPVVGAVNGYELRNLKTKYYVFDGEQCAMSATVETADDLEDTVKVSHVVVHPDYRRKGLAVGFYETIMRANRIVSDHKQTPSGRSLWQHLAQKHVVRPLTPEGLGQPIRDISPYYGGKARMVASLGENTLKESKGLKLGDFVTVKLNDHDADFWIIRRGTMESVGSPTETFSPESFGIKVVRTDVLLPKYLYYAIQNLHSRGYFKQHATGTLKLVGIKAEAIKNIDLG